MEPTIEVSYTEPTFASPLPAVYSETILGKFRQVTAIPTLVPRTLMEVIAVDTTAGLIYYYDFTNNVWKRTVGIATTDTLTNKRITPRVVSITSGASYTIDTDSYDCLSITALGTAINTIAVSGTPTNFQKLIVRIKDDATARAITWSTSFVSHGSTLPTTTVISKILTVGFIYDSVSAKWGCVAVQQQP